MSSHYPKAFICIIFLASYYSDKGMSHDLLTQFPIVGEVGCFYLFVVTHNDAQRIFVHKALYTRWDVLECFLNDLVQTSKIKLVFLEAEKRQLSASERLASIHIISPVALQVPLEEESCIGPQILLLLMNCLLYLNKNWNYNVKYRGLELERGEKR